MQIDIYAGWLKLLVTVGVIAGTVFLSATGKMDSQAAVALMGAILGYVFGNGHGIVSAKRVYEQQTPQAPAK